MNIEVSGEIWDWRGPSPFFLSTGLVVASLSPYTFRVDIVDSGSTATFEPLAIG